MRGIDRVLPTGSDLQSDTVKTGAIAVLLGVIVAGAQMLESFNVVSKDSVLMLQQALPYATIVFGYVSAIFRINIKTSLKNTNLESDV